MRHRSITTQRVPVIVDEEKCIADKGCRRMYRRLPLDVLWINEATGKAPHEVRRMLVLHALRNPTAPTVLGEGQHPPILLLRLRLPDETYTIPIAGAWPKSWFRDPSIRRVACWEPGRTVASRKRSSC